MKDSKFTSQKSGLTSPAREEHRPENAEERGGEVRGPGEHGHVRLVQRNLRRENPEEVPQADRGQRALERLLQLVLQGLRREVGRDFEAVFDAQAQVA